MAMSKNCYTKSTKRDGNGNIIEEYSYNVKYEYSEEDFPIKETVTNFDKTYSKVSTLEYKNIDY